MADVLTDELLKRIAESSARCYGHEGRSMAAELLQWRLKAKEAAARAAQVPAGAAIGAPAVPPSPFFP